MELENNKSQLVSKAISALKNSSKKCQNLEDFVKLAFDFNCGGISIEPLQNRTEIFMLLKILSDLKPKVIVEVGTASGGTLFLLSKIAKSNATIISIDLPGGPFGGELYPDWKMPLYESFASSNQNIHLVRADSHDKKTVEQIKHILKKQKIDFLLIDGDHTFEGLKKDFEMYEPLVNESGLISFHDITPGHDENVDVPKFWKKIKKNMISFEIREYKEKMGFGIGLLLQSNVDHHLISKISEILLELKSDRILELKKNPLSHLLSLYHNRNDLQKAFPEVQNNDFKNLINWATKIVSDESQTEKLAKYYLSNFSSWYQNFTQRENEISELDQLVKTKDAKLSEINSKAKQLNELIEQRENEILQLDKMVRMKDIHLKEVNNQAKRLSQLIEKRENEISKLDKEKDKLATQLQIKEKATSELEKEIEDLVSDISMKKNEVQNLSELINRKDNEMQNLSELINRKDNEVQELNWFIRQKEDELINTKDELVTIQKSFIFNNMRNISRKIDVVFPDETKRGNLKKIVALSLDTISNEGLKHYLSLVKRQISRREFSVPTPIILTETSEKSLKEKVNLNRKNRLKIKSHKRNELQKDEIVIPKEEHHF